MRFTVLGNKAVSREICDKQHQPPHDSKLYAYNTSMGNSNFNIWDASRLFSRLLRAQNLVRVIEGKIV